MSSIISAFTEDQVERLTGISRSQLRYWDKTDFFVPAYGYEDRKTRYSRLYSFRDLVCLKILNALRNDAKVSLPHLREVKTELTHLGDDLWAKTTLYVLHRKVVFVSPETKGYEEIVSKQGVLQIPLQIITDNMSDAVQRLSKRETSSPEIVRASSVAGNQYVIKGTRIPIDIIKEFSEAGYSIRKILNQYPSLSEDEVKAALAFDPAA